MGNMLNISKEAYEKITALKNAHNFSYSETILYLIGACGQAEKISDWTNVLEKAKQRAENYSGRKERINHDKIAYGVSRESS